MAPGLRSSSWCLLVCCLVGTVAEGQEGVRPAGGSPGDAHPTDCRVFTLTPPPPPTARKPALTRAPAYTFPGSPHGRPRVFPGFPGAPFHPPNCNHRLHLQFRPFFWPYGRLAGAGYFLGRRLRTGSSSEESTARRRGRAPGPKRPGSPRSSDSDEA